MTLVLVELTAQVEALFASTVQPSDYPTVASIRAAVDAVRARLGDDGCACLVAQEFGDHPVEACERMRWCSVRVAEAYA